MRNHSANGLKEISPPRRQGKKPNLFHIAKHLNAALDTVRRGEQSRLRDKEARQAAKDGRFLLLKRGTRVRGKAREKLRVVLASLGHTSRAWERKERFRRFWRYRNPIWANAYLRAWTTRAKRQYTRAIFEGMNHQARVSLARSYGHRSFEVLKLIRYHNLGDLPAPLHSPDILLARHNSMLR